MQIHPMWQQYPDLAPELTQTLQLIAKQVNTSHLAVSDAILGMINAGGKLLRPAYCLLFSQFETVDRDKMIALAAAIETLHTATLIHDDIIDQASVRRSLPTIQAQFGADTAVYAGDYLFVVCFKLLSHYASSLRSVQQDSNSMEKILNGELAQMATRFQMDITIEQYLRQVSGKTGQLFALSSFVGAFESGTSIRFSKKAEQIGMAIGIAFQLRDDILDYTSDNATLGKPVIEDVRNGVYSAPLIFAIQQAPEVIKPLLAKKQAITDTELLELQQLVKTHQGIAMANAMAERYTKQALNELTTLPDRPARATLIKLTQQLLTRNA